MVEALLRPDDDSALTEHKRLQLRELAALNGTLKDENMVRLACACTRVCCEALNWQVIQWLPCAGVFGAALWIMLCCWLEACVGWQGRRPAVGVPETVLQAELKWSWQSRPLADPTVDLLNPLCLLAKSRRWCRFSFKHTKTSHIHVLFDVLIMQALVLAQNQAAAGDIYSLPSDIKAKVEEQYQRDVARVHGAGAVNADDDYKCV